MARIVYSPYYNIGFFGLEKVHYFDSKKYGRAWKLLEQHFGSALRELTTTPNRPISEKELSTVHTSEYLAQLKRSSYLAKALEIGLLRLLPRWLINWCVLRPMRWATMGSLVAAREALTHGFAVNLGGGFHHAKPAAGEGFCIFNDIAFLIELLRGEGSLQNRQSVVYVDCDAHQGNGVCHSFMFDPRVQIFDIFNASIYPRSDQAARERIDCRIELKSGCGDAEYLNLLKMRLPCFLNEVCASHDVGLGVDNAGTDVHADDPLGRLGLSDRAILERDLMVVEELRKREIPTVMLLSGGYTKKSYQLIGTSVSRLMDQMVK